MANASLELRDLKTSQTMLVPPEGLIFGREGGDADVTFRDAGISKRHARVFQQGPNWMLQDLGSSNGTWMKGQRIGDAVKLTPGDIFILNKQQLQVLQVVMPTSAGAETYGDMPVQGGDEEQDEQNEPTPKPQPPPKPPPGRGAPEPRSAANKVPSQPAGSAKKAPPAMLRPAPDDLPEEPEPAAHEDAPEDEAPQDDAMPDDTGAADAGAAADQLQKAGIGYFMVAIPKAIAFYLGAIPVMLFNPVGTLRNGPKKMRFEAMGPMGLIPYALVPGLLGAVMGFVGALVSQVIAMIFYHGSLAIGGLITMLIVPPIVAVVVAVVTGFIWHPLMNWLIKILKGTSDAKSRTNYFVQFYTAYVLMQVPAFLTPVVNSFGLPVIGIIPVIVQAAASIILMAVSYFWMQYFGVMKWVPIVFLVLGGLTGLGALASIPGALHGRGGVGTVAVGSTGNSDMDAELAKLKAQGEANLKTGSDAEKQAEAARQAAQAEIDKALKDAKGATDKAVAAADQAKEDAKEATKPPPAKEEKKEAPPPKKEDKVAAKDSPPPPKDSGGDGNYGKWNSHRDQIEKFVTDDPQVLERVGGLADMYKKYEKLAYDAEQKCAKATQKSPADRRYNEHMRDLELFKQTNGLVGDMWERMGH